MNTSKETRQLKIDQNIIFDIIKSQAGTVDKALSELVMNSIDAGATEIKIELTDVGFSIVDNGKGFSSRESIIKWFETFGSKHLDGDAKYGRFRMGRGQTFSFASTKWRSGRFAMNVDIKNNGLNYDLTESAENFMGCQIDGVFYTKLSKLKSTGVGDFMIVEARNNKEYALKAITKSIKNMVLFVDVDVILNGEKINTNPKDCNWQKESDTAYYQLDFKKMHLENLDVYNMGVFVCSIPSSVSGCTGTVVSKKALKVNFARNDILREECSEFSTIMQEIRNDVYEFYKTMDVGTEEERIFFVRRVLSGDIEFDDYFKAKIFTDIGGYHTSLEKICGSYETISVAEPADPKGPGEKAMREEKAFIFSAKNLERFGVDNAEDFFAILDNFSPIFEYCDPVHYSEFLESYEDYSLEIPDKELNFNELYALKALRSQNAKLCNLVKSNRMFDGDLWTRKIHAGESEVAEAWTDGNFHIYINRTLLNKMGNGGYAASMKLATLIVHEYCHNETSSCFHDHDVYFYNLFHEAIIETRTSKGSLSEAVNKITEKYIKSLIDNKKPLPKELLNQAKQSSVEMALKFINDSNHDIVKSINKAEISPEQGMDIINWVMNLNVDAKWKELFCTIVTGRVNKKDILETVESKTVLPYWQYSTSNITTQILREFFIRLGVNDEKLIKQISKSKYVISEEKQVESYDFLFWAHKALHYLETVLNAYESKQIIGKEGLSLTLDGYRFIRSESNAGYYHFGRYIHDTRGFGKIWSKFSHEDVKKAIAVTRIFSQLMKSMPRHVMKTLGADAYGYSINEFGLQAVFNVGGNLANSEMVNDEKLWTLLVNEVKKLNPKQVKKQSKQSASRGISNKGWIVVG